MLNTEQEEVEREVERRGRLLNFTTRLVTVTCERRAP